MKILLATDGSEHSQGAAKFLTSLQLSSEDEITIFHAIPFIPCLYGQESYYNSLKTIKEEIAPRILDSVVDILKDVHAKLSTLVMDCSPEHAIIDIASESDTDLIVMGARGIKESESLSIGSLTRAVAINSSTPVLVTKLPFCEKTDETKILFATDGSKYSAATADILSKIPFSDRTEVTVVNVMPWELLDIPKTFVPEINERFGEIIEETRSARLMESKSIIDQAKVSLNKRFANIQALSQVGDPKTEIIKTSEKFKNRLDSSRMSGPQGNQGHVGKCIKKYSCQCKMFRSHRQDV